MIQRLILLALLLVPFASGSAKGAPIVYDFESPVLSAMWSTTDRSSYTYQESGGGTLVTSTYLGPVVGASISFFAMSLLATDLDDEAQPFRVDFDLVLFGGTGSEDLGVSSFGDPLDLGAASVGIDLLGGAPGLQVLRITNLYSAGPTPVDSSGCCSDVQLEWSVASNVEWGIDNLTIRAIPEPGIAHLLGLGLATLSGSRSLVARLRRR